MILILNSCSRLRMNRNIRTTIFAPPILRGGCMPFVNVYRMSRLDENLWEPRRTGFVPAHRGGTAACTVLASRLLRHGPLQPGKCLHAPGQTRHGGTEL